MSLSHRKSSWLISRSPGATGVFNGAASVRRNRAPAPKLRDPLLRPYNPSVHVHHHEGRRGTPAFIFDSARINDRGAARAGGRSGAGALAADGLIGVINSAVLLPTMVGFASIIYRDEFFTDEEHDYFPLLLKLVFLSAAVHQVCFLCLSSLPFAVGQVQDAGLIFLSSMAGKIVAQMKHQYEADHIVSTVVVTLALCTAMLGLVLWSIGFLRLANTVQYLPLPVIGGYLAFIGLFCGESGLRLMVNRADIVGLAGLVHLFNLEALRLSAPGFAAAAVLFVVSRKATNKLVLPLVLFAFPVAFYVVLAVAGESLEDARSNGWVKEAVDVPPFSKAFELIDFRKVVLSAAFPTVLPEFFAMCAVVAFGSCLDVAAIQFEMGRLLDYDRELRSVGASNIVSGIFGGYTGSYIFSQSIFALRNGVSTRVASLVIALVEIVIFLFPIDLLGFLPRFFFGCVLLFVAVDMLLDWLVIAYFNVDFKEYVIIVLTFLAINFTSLVTGMAIGVVLTALNFVFIYSRSNKVKRIPHPASNIIRALPDRMALDSQRERIVALKVTGFQFFGSTRQVVQAVKANLVFKKDQESQSNTPASYSNATSTSRPERSFHPQPDVISDTRSRAFSDVTGDSTREAFYGVSSARYQQVVESDSESLGSVATEEVRRSTRFVVLECSNISIIDATAARGCFLALVFMLQEHGIDLVFAGLPADCRRILVNHEVISEDKYEGGALAFQNMNAAMEWCESVLCSALYVNPIKSCSLASIFPRCIQEIRGYFEEREYPPNNTVIKRGEPADAIYIVQKGSVAIYDDSESNEFNLTSAFGHVDFLQQKPFYQFTAVTGSLPTTRCHVLTRNAFNAMANERPSAALAFVQTLYQIITRPKLE